MYMKKILFLFSVLVPLWLQAQSADPKDGIAPSQTETPLYTIVESMPEFPGGENAMMNYLATNIVYPGQAIDNNIEGSVYVSFIVETDGSVSNVEVLRGIGGGCDEEAVRVVAAMPKWKPGTQDGKPVRVQFRLPIRFKLTDPEPKKGNKGKK